MNTHTLNLAMLPFESIRNNKKTIESRLFDEKRKSIKLGDYIEFINRENPQDRITVEVIGLLRYKTFEDMFNNNQPNLFGGESAQRLSDQIHEFYSKEDEMKFGVIGIQFIKLI